MREVEDDVTTETRERYEGMAGSRKAKDMLTSRQALLVKPDNLLCGDLQCRAPRYSTPTTSAQ